MALQLLEKDLGDELERIGTLDQGGAIEYARQILEGVSCFHDRGITHRDLKPSNIGIADGNLLIGDFGLAKDENVTKMTRTGTVLGTLLYMPPEQVRGEQATSASDIYSVGVILFEMLTGKLPHQASSVSDLIRRIQEEPTPDVTSLVEEIDPEFGDLITSMLSKAPEDRPTARAALEILRTLQ